MYFKMKFREKMGKLGVIVLFYIDFILIELKEFFLVLECDGY